MLKYLNPCLVHPVALAINKKNETCSSVNIQQIQLRTKVVRFS
jgi:hypothetical protein